MRQVSFSHSDIEGRKALLISVRHGAGEAGPEGLESVHTIKLFADELAEAADIAATDPSEKIAPADYSNIRECIGHFIGRTIEDITQHDSEEFQETRRSYIQLLLSGGDYLKFFIGPDGFVHSEDDDS